MYTVQERRGETEMIVAYQEISRGAWSHGSHDSVTQVEVKGKKGFDVHVIIVIVFRRNRCHTRDLLYSYINSS